MHCRLIALEVWTAGARSTARAHMVRRQRQAHAQPAAVINRGLLIACRPPGEIIILLVRVSMIACLKACIRVAESHSAKMAEINPVCRLALSFRLRRVGVAVSRRIAVVLRVGGRAWSMAWIPM
jgi:hypothetical protein